jgi:hypothetical protein
VSPLIDGSPRSIATDSQLLPSPKHTRQGAPRTFPPARGVGKFTNSSTGLDSNKVHSRCQSITGRQMEVYQSKSLRVSGQSPLEVTPSDSRGYLGALEHSLNYTFSHSDGYKNPLRCHSSGLSFFLLPHPPAPKSGVRYPAVLSLLSFHYPPFAKEGGGIKHATPASLVGIADGSPTVRIPRASFHFHTIIVAVMGGWVGSTRLVTMFIVSAIRASP